MSEIIISGLVATTPRHLVTQDGLPITSFRLAASGSSADVGRVSDSTWTNWFTITAFKQLAVNSAMSISKGDRIIVSGILKIRDWDNGDRAGTSVEIESIAIGHDLNYGSSVFSRTTHMSNDGTTTSLEVQTVDEESVHSCNCRACDD
jgi:single-strand DNA-binding protein